MERQTGAIRLTNRTALALRKSARQERALARWTIAVVTLVLGVAAVLAGIRWLPAVPMLTGLAVLLDAAIYVRGRSRYLSLTGQAICAEAAARQMRADKTELDRQRQALRDLEEAKADVNAGEPDDTKRAAPSARRSRPERQEDNDPDLGPEEDWTPGGEMDDSPDLRPPEEKPPERGRVADSRLRGQNDGKRQNPFAQLDSDAAQRPDGRTAVFHPASKNGKSGESPQPDGDAQSAPEKRASDKTIVRSNIRPVRRDGDESAPTGKTIEMPRLKKTAVQTDGRETSGFDGQDMTTHRRRRQAALTVLLPEDGTGTSH